jgi:hypothetical protein
MLGAIAAVALVVGAIGATVSVGQNDPQTTDHSPVPVVEVQTVQSTDTAAE